MTPAVTAAVLLAAVTHASWNAIAHRIKAAAGVAVSCAGLTGVPLWGLRGRRPDWAAIVAALATGLTIAAYTAVDGLAVRASGSSFGYIAWLMAVQGVVIPAYAALRWRGGTIALLRPFALPGLLGSALSVAAYALVLWAQTRAELAPVAALRELVNRNDTETTREGQITDRYTAAIDNLGNSSADVRLGGIYALQRIMKDSSRDQASIVDVLCAYIRVHSRSGSKASAGYVGRPEADVQAAFEVLARRDPAHDGSSEVDLRESYLPYMAVRSASRSGTIEEDRTGVDAAHLPDSNLSGADLSNANLPGSDLHGSYLVGVALNGAALNESDLRQDWLDNADLSRARLDGAGLQKASLVDASLNGASLRDADLQNADLRGVDLTGADLEGADLRGANLRTAPKRTVGGKEVGWTSLKTTHVTVSQLLTARLDSTTVLPPALAGDPKIKAKIAESEA